MKDKQLLNERKQLMKIAGLINEANSPSPKRAFTNDLLSDPDYIALKQTNYNRRVKDMGELGNADDTGQTPHAINRDHYVNKFEDPSDDLGFKDDLEEDSEYKHAKLKENLDAKYQSNDVYKYEVRNVHLIGLAGKVDFLYFKSEREAREYVNQKPKSREYLGLNNNESKRMQKLPGIVNELKLINIVRQMLSEASFDQLKQQFVDTKKVTQDVFDVIEKVCGGKSAYATWLLSKVVNKIIKEEDIYKFEDYFKTFDKNKQDFDLKDIFLYKTQVQVQDFIKKAIEISEKNIEYTGGDSKNKLNLVSAKGIEEMNRVGIKFLGIVDGYQCFDVPTTSKGDENAFNMYRKYLADCSGRSQGAKIAICTMASIDRFNEYLEDGPFYVFFNLNDPKSPYQFHYESNQFMNKNDATIL